MRVGGELQLDFRPLAPFYPPSPLISHTQVIRRDARDQPGVELQVCRCEPAGEGGRKGHASSQSPFPCPLPPLGMEFGLEAYRQPTPYPPPPPSDMEFGRIQARDLLQHLWTGPISNAPVEIIQVGGSAGEGRGYQVWRRMENTSRCGVCAGEGRGRRTEETSRCGGCAKGGRGYQVWRRMEETSRSRGGGGAGRVRCNPSFAPCPASLLHLTPPSSPPPVSVSYPLPALLSGRSQCGGAASGRDQGAGHAAVDGADRRDGGARQSILRVCDVYR